MVGLWALVCTPWLVCQVVGVGLSTILCFGWILLRSCLCFFFLFCICGNFTVVFFFLSSDLGVLVCLQVHWYS